MTDLKSLTWLLVGALLGWSASRYFGEDTPKVSIAPSSAAATATSAAMTAGACALPEKTRSDLQEASVSVSAPSSDHMAIPSLVEQLSKLKIAELYKSCADAELNYLNKKMANHSQNVSELQEPERAQALTEWNRRFTNLANNGSYWKGELNLTFGNDKTVAEILVDLQANTDDQYKCFSWTMYIETNGKPSPESYFSQSFCDGHGFRKKGDQFYFDVNTYSLASLGKHVTKLLFPMPGEVGSCEYLGGEVESWVSVPQFSWQRSSIIEFSQMQQRFVQKIEQAGDAP